MGERVVFLCYHFWTSHFSFMLCLFDLLMNPLNLCKNVMYCCVIDETIVMYFIGVVVVFNEVFDHVTKVI